MKLIKNNPSLRLAKGAALAVAIASCAASTSHALNADVFSVINIDNGGVYDDTDKSFIVLVPGGANATYAPDAVGVFGANSATYSQIYNFVINGYNGGAWNGAVNVGGPNVGGNILSSTAAIASPAPKALGIISNGSTTTYGTFGGIALSGTGQVLVKYTYAGDANIDGSIGAADYGILDAGVSGLLTRWENGDFNYDSAIGAADYGILDNAVQNWGGVPLFVDSGTKPPGGGLVPEPGAASLLLLGALGLLGQRRKRSNSCNQ